MLVLLCIAAGVIIALGGVSATLSRTATREVNKFLATLPDVETGCAEIQVHLLTGTAIVKELRFIYHEADSKQSADSLHKADRGKVPGVEVPGVEVHIARVEVAHVLYSVLAGHKISVDEVSIVEPAMEVWLNEQQPERCLPPFMRDSAAEPIEIPFQQILLKKLQVEDAAMQLHSLSGPLNVAIKGCSLAMQQLSYDSAFHFNDSLYAFSLASASVRLPDGRSRIISHDIDLKARGILSVGNTRFFNTNERMIAERIPGADFRLGRLEIGPLSHAKLFQRELLIDAIQLYRPHAELWLDEDHPDLCFPKTKQTRTKPHEPISFPFKRIELGHLLVHNASFALHSTRTELDMAADSCSLGFHHLRFTERAMICDSVYELLIASGSVVMPDGLMRLSTRQIHRSKQGIFSVGETSLAYKAEEARAGQCAGVDMRVGGIEIGPLSFHKLWDREVVFETARLIRPRAEIWLDEEQPTSCFPSYEKKAPSAKPSKLKQAIYEQIPEGGSLIRLWSLRNAVIENASLALHSTRTSLDVVADSCSVAAHDLAFDKTFHYNDTAYSFSLAHATVTLPDGSMRMETRDIRHRDQGELHIGPSRIVHNMEKKALGDRVQEPVTWIDMRLERADISPLNPIRKVLKQDYTIDNIDAVISFMDIFRDERYAPKSPFRMPQKVLMDLPVTFYVRHVDSEIKKIHIDFASTDINIGQLELGRIHAGVDHITNRRGYTMRVEGGCPMDQGQAHAVMEMTMNQDCRFAMQMHAKHINTSAFNSLIRPLVGMTSDCRIDSIQTQYSGNSVKAEGTFRMIYHDFSMKVHKQDDIPYQIITKMAHSFTHIGNTMVPKSNPLTKHGKPHGYRIEWKRDELKPVELYLFGPLIDGIKKTFLPGLYIHVRTKNEETYLL